MKLYFSPGACSLASHIALQETGLPFETEKVDLRAKTTAGGADFKAINPKGAVPALRMNDGELLTEGAVILQYVSDQKPESKLMPAAGTLARYRAQELLNYIAAEIHKTFSPLFYPSTSDEQKATIRQTLATRFALLVSRMGAHKFLLGDEFMAPDAYMFTMLNWAKMLHVDMPAELAAYYDRIAARPAVQAALKAEGMLK